MEFTGIYCAQGDLNIIRVDAIPRGLAETADRVLAHSETGHHHVLEGNAVRVMKQDDFVSFIEVTKPAKIVHLRSFDTHAPISLAPGKYRISRQREYVPEGFRVAQD